MSKAIAKQTKETSCNNNNTASILTFEEWKASQIIMTPQEAKEHFGEWFEVHTDVEQYIVFDKDGPLNAYVDDCGWCYFIDVEGDWKYIRKDELGVLDEYLKKVYEWHVWAKDNI